MADTVSAPDVERMRACLVQFARIWAINEPLKPSPYDSLRLYIAITWPTMADCKEAYDLVWHTRKDHE